MVYIFGTLSSPPLKVVSVIISKMGF